MPSDATTFTKESANPGFPDLTRCNSIERLEVLDSGGIVMTGLDGHHVVDAVKVAMVSEQGRSGTNKIVRADSLIDNKSYRAARLVLSTARSNAVWLGARKR